MRVNKSKSTLAFCILLGAGIAGLCSDFGLGAGASWKQAHTLTHFFFGLGFPFYWVGLFSGGLKASAKPWQITINNKITRHLGDGFWLGAAITSIWSTGNEIIVYWIYNPTHGADWHHWAADQIGSFFAYQLCKAISRRNGGCFDQLRCDAIRGHRVK